MLQLQIQQAPPSVNSFYRHTGKWTYITPKGREFKKYVEEYLKNIVKERNLKPYMGEIEVFYEFHFRGKRKRDTSNYVKPVEDMMKGILFGDDDQVKRFTAEKFINALENKCEIRIIKYNGDNDKENKEKDKPKASKR